MDGKTSQVTAVQTVDRVLVSLERPLQCLSISHIRAIDDALAAIAAYAEVRLIKNRGKLRFIQTVKSRDLAASR